MNLLLHKLKEMVGHGCEKAHWPSPPKSPPLKFESGFPAKNPVNPGVLPTQPMTGLQAVSQFKVEIIDVVTTMDCTSMVIMLSTKTSLSLSLSLSLSPLVASNCIW